jgi:large subunit ribosomal protein L21
MNEIMYAVVKIGGHQYKVSEEQTVFVNRLSVDGDKVTLDDVLLVKDEKGKVKVGTPNVKGSKVEATVVDHLKADKVIVFKKKRRKGYRVKNGHRQAITQLKIDKIS